MKKTLMGSALAAGLLFSTTTALAGTGYVGIDYQMLNVSFDESELDDFEPQAIALRVGGSLSDYAQLEARFGSSVADDNTDDGALAVDNLIGFYLKGGMELMDLVFPYLAVGFTKVDFSSPGELSETESDLSYGLGADLHFGDFQVGAEYMVLQDKTDYQLDAISVSAAWRF